MDGKSLIIAAVLAALVLVVGAHFVVASAQARSPVQQCFDAISAAAPPAIGHQGNQDFMHWVLCLEAASGSPRSR